MIMKPFITTVMTRTLFGIAITLGVFVDSGLRAATVTNDTVGTYRTIAVSKSKEMASVREATEGLEARGYTLYATPTVILLSADCHSQAAVCNPIYLVTQRAGLGQRGHYSKIQVVGAVISPTTVFGSGEKFIPPERMLQLRAFLGEGPND
jgi:hypothetical protein